MARLFSQEPKHMIVSFREWMSGIEMARWSVLKSKKFGLISARQFLFYLFNSFTQSTTFQRSSVAGDGREQPVTQEEVFIYVGYSV